MIKEPFSNGNKKAVKMKGNRVRRQAVQAKYQYIKILEENTCLFYVIHFRLVGKSKQVAGLI